MRAALPRVRLIRKLAHVLNGFDLSKAHVGQVLSVSEPIAEKFRRACSSAAENRRRPE